MVVVVVVEGKTGSRAMENENGRKLLSLRYGSSFEVTGEFALIPSTTRINRSIIFLVLTEQRKKQDIYRSGVSDKSPENNA